MRRRNAYLCALRAAHPMRWLLTCRAALRAHRTVKGAARALGVSALTLTRWARECPSMTRGCDLKYGTRSRLLRARHTH